ncbi:MAG: PAS domain S-box protein, partial [Pseudomonadota bacterium]
MSKKKQSSTHANELLRQAEEALRESEEKYLSLYEGSRDGICHTDMEGRLLEFNTSYKEMLGYTAEELRGKSYKEITPPCWEAMEDRIVREQILGRGYSDVYEKEYIRKDGTVLPVAHRAYLIKKDGKHIGMWGITRDITGRKQAETKLREMSHVNEQIISCAQDGVIIYGLDMRYQFWNPFMEQLIGMTSAEVLGKHPLELFPFLLEAGVITRIEKALTGEASDFIDFPIDIPSTGKSGWVLYSTAPLRNLHGEIIGAIGTIRDITRRKQAEDAQLELRQAI